MEKLKRGHVREDGMVLLRRKGDKEQYVSKECYDRCLEYYKNYRAKRRESYRATERKWKIGEFNPENNLYFIRNNGAYRPIFGTMEQVNAYRKTIGVKQTIYYQNRKPYEKVRRRGDVDPVLNLVFWRYHYRTGGEFWVTRENYLERLEKERSFRRKKDYNKI